MYLYIRISKDAHLVFPTHWKNVPVATFQKNDIRLFPACFAPLSKWNVQLAPLGFI